MSALFDITQATLGPGLGPGNARVDGVPGELVTITVQDPTVQEVQITLRWTPPNDEEAFFNLTPNPADIKKATFTPTANAVNASGSYMILVVTDASNPARRDEAELVFVIVTPNSGLVIPALNEPGNPLASLVNPVAPGAANNVPFLGPGRNVVGSPIANINFAAWWKSLADLTLVVDGFSGGAGEVNTGVNVGAGVGLVDGVNLGVQIPVRTVDGINDVGVALNGQVVEVDGVLLLDLTAVRHITGSAPLTLEYAATPTIQLHDNTSGAEIDKRWSIQAQVPDGPPRLYIGAAPTDGASLVDDNAGLLLERSEGTANVALVKLLGETIRLQSGQVTGGGTVLIRPDGVVSDEYPLLTMESNGANNASLEWHVGDRTPVGNITGTAGDFYVRADNGVSSTFYQHNGATPDNTSWVEIGAGAAGLQGNYNIGALIDATAAQGPVTIDVTAAEGVGPLTVKWDANTVLEVTAFGNVGITSFDAGNDLTITSALAGLTLVAPSGLALLEGVTVDVRASTGLLRLFNDVTTGAGEGFQLSGAGSASMRSAANTDAIVEAKGTGNLSLIAVGDDILLNSLNLGFYNTTPAPRPDITGSRGGNAALADLLTELATLGLITDSST